VLHIIDVLSGTNTFGMANNIVMPQHSHY